MLRARALVGAAALTLVLTGCGSSADQVGAAGTPGVTSAPCPNAVNPGHGCIYLGTLTDLSGPFKLIAVPATQAQRAFWHRVNVQGGIGGYDIDVTTYLRDARYDTAAHVRAYGEIKDRVLALAQTLGSAQTEAILPDMRTSKIIAAPMSWTSQWAFASGILPSGASYCFESMNSVDYAVEVLHAKSVMAVHYAGDYGGDAAFGARVAAEAHGLPFKDRETPQGASAQEGAVDAIVKARPGLVVLTTAPSDAAAIVGQAYLRGYTGHYIGTRPTWAGSLLKSPAASALKAQYLQSSPWRPFATDSPGHTAMRAALGRVQPSDAYVDGWTFSYPLKAVLEKAVANHRLNRAGLLDAVKQITTIDYEGILPAAAGDLAGSPNAHAFRQTVIGRPDEGQLTGIRVIRDFFEGSTARSYNLSAPCYRAQIAG